MFNQRSFLSIILASLLLISPASGTIPPFFLSAGPNSPSNAANGGIPGAATWSSPTNIFTSNNTRASASCSGGSQSPDQLSIYGFGFSLPGDATVTGFSVAVEGYSDSSSNVWTSIYLARNVPGGSGISPTATSSQATPTSEGTVTFTQSIAGSPTWGLTWTAAEVNASSFGLLLNATNNSGGATNFYIDHVTVTVDYTIAPKSGGFFRLFSFDERKSQTRVLDNLGAR